MATVLCEGTLYVDRKIAGVSQGLVQWPGIAKLSIKPNSELKEALTKDKGKYGNIVSSIAVAKPADLAISLREITGDSLATALQGSRSDFSQGSGSATDQAVTAKLGKYIELGKRNIAAAGFVVTNDAASVTYVLDTDYSVNYVAGWLYIIPTGSITESQALKLDYTYGAVAGDKILGATTPQVKGKLILDGKNLDNEQDMILTIWDATLTADGEVDFMSDDPVELSMTGRMSTPTDKSSPFEIEYGLTLS